MSEKKDLPFSKQMTFALGQLGWSTLISIISMQLVYYYIPPDNSGLPNLITQTTFFVVLNVVTFLAVGGRLFDAITDPLIANLSDRRRGKWGRRIPFMAMGAFPAAIFCVLLFIPPDPSPTAMNIVWLALMQVGFYLFLTMYVTPYFALLAELGHTPVQRLNLSTYISVTYALGAATAASVPVISGLVKEAYGLDTLSAFRAVIMGLAFVAFLFMMLPVITIRERDYCEPSKATVALLPAMKRTFQNKNFLFYVTADFSYFASNSIIFTGLLYYTTVLLFPKDLKYGLGMAAKLPAVMVGASFLLYPVVNILARKLGKKRLIVFSMGLFSLVFLGMAGLGMSPLDNNVEAYGIMLILAVPIAFLGVLPNAVLSDIAEHDGLKSGVRQEGMFFAVRTLIQKFGMTFGIFVFAALTTFGKDPGNDLGIRLSGIVGALLCLFSAVVFQRYKEKDLLDEMEELEGSDRPQKLTVPAKAERETVRV